MFWTLVFIMIVNGEPEVQNIGTYQSMNDCFHEREKLASKLDGMNGHFPVNYQAVCILSE